MSGFTAAKGFVPITALIVFAFHAQKDSSDLSVGPHLDVRELSTRVPSDGCSLWLDLLYGQRPEGELCAIPKTKIRCLWVWWPWARPGMKLVSVFFINRQIRKKRIPKLETASVSIFNPLNIQSEYSIKTMDYLNLELTWWYLNVWI